MQMGISWFMVSTVHDEEAVLESEYLIITHNQTTLQQEPMAIIEEKIAVNQ